MTSSNVSKKVDENLDAAVSHLKEAASSSKDNTINFATKKYEDGLESAKNIAEKTESYVKEKPVASIAIAFGIGWVASKLITRK